MALTDFLRFSSLLAYEIFKKPSPFSPKEEPGTVAINFFLISNLKFVLIKDYFFVFLEKHKRLLAKHIQFHLSNLIHLLKFSS